MRETSSDGVAVVTGGASGIGLAVVERLHADGRKVVIADRDEDRAAEIAERLGAHVRSVAVDVSSTESVDALVADVGAREGRLDVLVAAAGVAAPEPSHTLADASWQRLIDVHLGGTMRCCRAAFPLLCANGGSIVAVASVGARVGSPRRLAYNAAKAGIEAVTRTLAVEWAREGVRVNAVAPGYTNTALIEALIDEGKLDAGRIVARVPLGRFAEPREIAGAVAFLASADASYVTGQSLLVDGGMTIDGDWYA